LHNISLSVSSGLPVCGNKIVGNKKEMTDQGDEVRKVKKVTERINVTQVYADDMNEDWAKDAVRTAREAFALTIASGDVNSTRADYIRRKFDRDHDVGWNCIVGRSFGAYVTHEIKTYIYYSIHSGTFILLWRS
jgi:dynein light chain LC8-type